VPVLPNGALLMKEAGIDMVHVPYRGKPEAINDPMGGASPDVIVEAFAVIMHKTKALTVIGVVEIVRQPAMRQRFPTIGFEPAGQDVNTFAAYHATEVARWKRFASEIGMSK
jgi:tripartite-type tricarboxylate transporter receptor subunit TctC